MIKVLVTGPESSGKSHLVNELSNHFNSPKVLEYSRVYLNNKTSYKQEDLIKIAAGQLESEKMACLSQPEILFCDTGIEVIQIWSKVKYNSIDSIILKAGDTVNYDFVLLCKPNIPWEEDPLRENPFNRKQLFALYIEHFKNAKCDVQIIDAPLNDRIMQAIYFLQQFNPQVFGQLNN